MGKRPVLNKKKVTSWITLLSAQTLSFRSALHPYLRLALSAPAWFWIAGQRSSTSISARFFYEIHLENFVKSGKSFEKIGKIRCSALLPILVSALSAQGNFSNSLSAQGPMFLPLFSSKKISHFPLETLSVQVRYSGTCICSIFPTISFHLRDRLQINRNQATDPSVSVRHNGKWTRSGSLDRSFLKILIFSTDFGQFRGGEVNLPPPPRNRVNSYASSN